MDLQFKKKWGIIIKAIIIMLILLVPRTIIDHYGFDVVPINTIVGAFITGAIFTIAIIFTGTFTDFKESEKVGGDLAAALKALYNDSCVLPVTDEAPARELRVHVRAELLIIAAGNAAVRGQVIQGQLLAGVELQGQVAG